MHLDVD